MINISSPHRAHEFQSKPRSLHRRNFLKHGVALVGASALLATRSSQAGASSTPSGGTKAGALSTSTYTFGRTTSSVIRLRPGLHATTCSPALSFQRTS